VSDCAEGVVPSSWQLLIFGSASRCQGSGGRCQARQDANDIDLLVVYPAREWAEAIEARRQLATLIAQRSGMVADIVLLSRDEEAESDFAQTESARPLVTCPPGRANAAASGSGF